MTNSRLMHFFNGVDWVSVTPTEIPSTQLFYQDLCDVLPPKYHAGQEVTALSGGQWLPATVIRVGFTPVKIGARGKGYTWTYDVDFNGGGSARRFIEEVRDAEA